MSKGRASKFFRTARLLASMSALAILMSGCFQSPKAPGRESARQPPSSPQPPAGQPPPAAQPPAATPPPLQGTRDPSTWPFSADSPWNHPAGSGAQFASTSDPRHIDLHADGGGYINAQYWSHPVVQAGGGDPTRSVTDPYGTSWYRIPWSAVPSNPLPGGDQHMHVVDPAKQWVDESWLTSPQGQNFSSGYHVRNDLRGDGVGDGGTRAYGGSAIGGLVRRWELEQGAIRHALAFAVPRARLRQGPVWPASSEDTGSEGTYLGNLPMGSFVLIPGSVNLSALGLSPQGLAIARALQDYGAYITDGSSQFVLFAEPSAESLLGPARADLGRIKAELRVVTNSSPSNVGGGGTPRAPFAPPFS